MTTCWLENMQFAKDDSVEKLIQIFYTARDKNSFFDSMHLQRTEVLQPWLVWIWSLATAVTWQYQHGYKNLNNPPTPKTDYTKLVSYNKEALFLFYLDQRLEAPLPKHVLEEGVVLWAADMGLQLGGQSRQQLIQAWRRGRGNRGSAWQWEV